MPRALLEFHSPSAGMIAAPVPTSSRVTTVGIFAIVTALILMACLTSIDRVVTASGSLVPPDRTIVVQPFEEAIVGSIKVREGDVVRSGQIIAELDPTIATAEIVDLHRQEQSYSAEVARLTAQTKGVEYKPDPANPEAFNQVATFRIQYESYSARIRDYDQQISEIKAELAGYQAAAIGASERLRIAIEVQAIRLKLQRLALGSRLNVLSATDDVAAMQDQEATALADTNAAKAKIASLVAEKTAFMTGGKAKLYALLADAQRNLYQTRDQLAAAGLRNRLIVFRAPKPAMVLTIAKVSVGSVLQPGADFITLMPVAEAFAVVGRMPASQSGYVRLGDKATIKFATLPYALNGGAEGTVTNISADSFTTTGVDGSDATSLAEAGNPKEIFYRVRIAIDRYTLHRAPRSFRLTPGMPVTADIQIGRRTIMQYLLSGPLPHISEGSRAP